MDNFAYFYHHFPLYLNPALKIGFFSVSWYSIMYLIAFFVVYLLLKHRIKKGEWELKIENQNLKPLNLIIDFLIYSFAGLLIGARLGEILFYNPEYYIQNPLATISPFDPSTHEFIGIYGMSYHGGLIGVLAATFIFIKRRRVNFWDLSDFVVPAIPAGYFFGRIGNFINNELYGKITGKSWGMYFKDDLLNLRHPSQLYEAFLEGVILFIILWKIRNKKMFKGYFLPIYLVGYAIFRFISEFFREPEYPPYYSDQILTTGQILSIAMIIFAAILIAWRRKNWYNDDNA